MAQRVADADVKEILETDLNTQPFIVAASLLVDQHLASQGLSAALLTEIERWLAAHFVCIRDPRVQQARADTVSMTMALGRLGEGLKSTPYGQQVLALDPTGILGTVTTAKRVSIKVY